MAGSNATGISSAKPRPGGSLLVGVESEVNGFNPRSGRFDPGGILYARAVFDPLFAYAADGSVKPYLAQSYSHSPDYSKWTIVLRSGVKFHDGTTCDAAAVKQNLDSVKSSALTGPALGPLVSTTVTDPLTLVVTMNQPWVAFPVYLTGQLGFMAAPSMLNSPTGTSLPVGTGPWKYSDWAPNDHFTVVKNPSYWRPGLPYLDQITFKPIPDTQSRDNSLLSGTVDLIHSSDTDTLVALRGKSGYQVITDGNNHVGEPDMDFVMLNCAKPPLDDVRVRRALAYATNEADIISAIQNGLLQPSDGPFPPGSPYHAPTGYPQYNVSQAQSLVASYVRDKGPISFQLATTNSTKSLQTVQLLQSMWAQVNIHATLTQVEQTQHILNALKGDYQANTWRQFAAPDPDINYVWWSIENAAPIGQLALNFARNKDQQIQNALLTGRSHTDPSVRAQAYQTVAKRFGADSPYIWMSKTLWTAAAKNTVQNFNGGTTPDGTQLLPMTGGFFWLTQAWLSR